ncbi:phosphotransferase family protein [Rhodococcus sp. ACT016]|uniref:phosphotransferase family protein n=1 Tax=Rhodococcus sp. ACT016 TaxID=3134808 RepID=UPI003D2E0788
MSQSTISRTLGEAESEGLAHWLADRLPGAGAVTIAPLAQTAGRSHAVYLLTRGDLRWVLRVAPNHREASVGGAFDLSREGRILDALTGTGVPHPAAVVVRDDSAPTRRDFLVSEFVDGITLDRSLPQHYANERDARAITDSIVDTLARVNAVDWRSTTLVDTTRPDGYLARQFDKAASMLEKFRTRDIPMLERLLSGLRRDQPADYRLGLIHGDYSAMNIMVDRERAAVKAVLDWETATVGDAMVDIGYLTARWARPEEDPLMAAFALGGGDPAAHDLLPSRGYVAERYAEASGRPMDLLPFYQGLAMARLAVVLEGRVAAGRRRGRTEMADMFATMADGCAAHGLRLAGVDA